MLAHNMPKMGMNKPNLGTILYSRIANSTKMRTTILNLRAQPLACIP